MRKIEKDMLNAIKSGRNWMQSNTAVNHTATGADVFLHGNHIAHVSPHGGAVAVNKQTLMHWPTRTTLSRLRALGVDVGMRAGKVFINGEEI